MKLKFAGKRIEWDDGCLDVPVSVKEAVRIGDVVLVVHDYMAYPLKHPAPNLVAYKLNGEKLWVAENLTKAEPADAYVGFHSAEPLWVYNFMGFNCRIDPQTGKLLERLQSR